MNARTLRAWRRTAYGAGTAVARVGRRSAAIDAVLRAMGARRGAFVTACNPLGRRVPDGVNSRGMRRLREAVRRMPAITGCGEGRGWREPHLLLLTDWNRARRLGRVFRQLGLVLVQRGGVARIVLLPAAVRPPRTGRTR